MGVVVAARHLELGELFAIKFLLPQALASAQPVDRFLREARASARLNELRQRRKGPVAAARSAASRAAGHGMAGARFKVTEANRSVEGGLESK
jgi:serine/threonine-protein kinase